MNIFMFLVLMNVNYHLIIILFFVLYQYLFMMEAGNYFLHFVYLFSFFIFIIFLIFYFLPISYHIILNILTFVLLFFIIIYFYLIILYILYIFVKHYLSYLYKIYSLILIFNFLYFFPKIYHKKFTFNSNFKLLHVISTCFSLFAIVVIRSSSAFVFCLGGNFIGALLWGDGYFDFAFLEVDLAEEGGGGIYPWKSLYILSATNVSNISGVGPNILCPTFTNDLFYFYFYMLRLPDCGLLFPDFDDYFEPGLLLQLFSILKSPLLKMLMRTIFFKNMRIIITFSIILLRNSKVFYITNIKK